MYDSKKTTSTESAPSSRKGSEGGGSGGYALPQTGVRYVKICLHGHRDCDLH